jgi:hypothetical protein
VSPVDRVAQLYPQAPGSIFVAFYDSMGYGGVILTSLHAGAHFSTLIFYESFLYLPLSKEAEPYIKIDKGFKLFGPLLEILLEYS